MLDTLVAGSVGGKLAISQLQLLERALEAAPDTHHLICLHHHPVPIGSSWMDSIGLANPDALFEVLDRHANVRALLWGHIHQEFDSWRKGVRLLASPSTGVQFEPGSERFRVSAQPPGYRWLRLHDDGRLDTGVSRISPLEISVDCDVSGY
jgi:Icc protein